jgi:hypothetical protein
VNQSKYLEQITKECAELRKPMAKRTLTSVVILVILSIVIYIGLPALDSRAAGTALFLSVPFLLIALIFFIKFLRLNSAISSSSLMKNQKEIENNLISGETISDFDSDIANPAFGKHIINDSTILVGHKFILFQSLTSNGPHFKILRGDILGNFDVHYFSQNGVPGDIGVDINNKNGKFIRSIMTSDKDSFYKLINAMENLKAYANGEAITTEQAALKQDNEFVSELKNKVTKQDKKGATKLGFLGMLFGVFLVIAGSSSGVAFVYAGLALLIISIIFTITINVRKRTE